MAAPLSFYMLPQQLYVWTPTCQKAPAHVSLVHSCATVVLYGIILHYYSSSTRVGDECILRAYYVGDECILRAYYYVNRVLVVDNIFSPPSFMT